MFKSCYFIILQHVGMKKLKILKKKFRFGLRKIFSPLKTFGYNFWTEGQIEKFIGIKNDPLVFLRGVSMKKSYFTPKWVFSFFHFGHFQKILAAILLIFFIQSNWCTLALSTWEFISKRKFNIRRTVFPVGPGLRHSRSKNPEFQKIPTHNWEIISKNLKTNWILILYELSEKKYNGWKFDRPSRIGKYTYGLSDILCRSSTLLCMFRQT